MVVGCLTERLVRVGGGEGGLCRGGPGEILGSPTAPPGPSPEIEGEKGRSSSKAGKHSREGAKEDRLKTVIRMTLQQIFKEHFQGKHCLIRRLPCIGGSADDS